MVYYMSFGHDDKVNGVHLTAEAASRHNTSRKENIRYSSVPEEWGMFTKKGNQRITQLAERFIVGLAYGHSPMTVAERFCKSFARLYNTKTMGEASDTDVREQVFSFLERFSPINRCSFGDLWSRECA